MMNRNNNCIVTIDWSVVYGTRVNAKENPNTRVILARSIKTILLSVCSLKQQFKNHNVEFYKNVCESSRMYEIVLGEHVII